jgi:hypothetical protein
MSYSSFECVRDCSPDGAGAAVSSLSASFRQSGVFTLEHITSLVAFYGGQFLLEQFTCPSVGGFNIYIPVNHQNRISETIKIFLQGHAELGEEMKRALLTNPVRNIMLRIKIGFHHSEIFTTPSADFFHARPTIKAPG